MKETLEWVRAMESWPEPEVTVLAEHNGMVFMAEIMPAWGRHPRDYWIDIVSGGPCEVTWWAYVFGPNPRGA